jgi:hypothetical protein|tara:strand:+ start:232 stop:585 length:354 start_codon:yes stop_codon:yes gene_type:complete
MTLNTDWRAVTDKIGRKHLEASGQNDFNLGMWLCTMEIPVIHSETVGELYFRTNLFNHLTRGTTDIKFERFMGYKCNAGFAPRAKWIGRMVKLHAPKSLVAKEVWKYYHETGREKLS